MISITFNKDGPLNDKIYVKHTLIQSSYFVSSFKFINMDWN
jgi:hypothetical protein